MKRKILYLALAVVILVTMMSLFSGCSDDTLTPAEAAAGNQIRLVRQQEMFAGVHPGVTNEDVLSHFMESVSNSTSRSDGNWYVSLSGKLKESESLRITFKITDMDENDDGFDVWISPYSITFDGDTVTDDDVAIGFLLAMYEAYSAGYEYFDPYSLSVEPISATFGSVFEYLGFEIIINDNWNVLDFGIAGEMFQIPIRIKNISDTTDSFGAIARIWCPNGLARAGGIGYTPEMRAGASLDTDISFENHGDGIYIVELYDLFVGGVDVIITLPITLSSFAQQTGRNDTPATTPIESSDSRAERAINTVKYGVFSHYPDKPIASTIDHFYSYDDDGYDYSILYYSSEWIAYYDDDGDLIVRNEITVSIDLGSISPTVINAVLEFIYYDNDTFTLYRVQEYGEILDVDSFIDMIFS
jgi:hypothetical protein